MSVAQTAKRFGNYLMIPSLGVCDIVRISAAVREHFVPLLVGGADRRAGWRPRVLKRHR